MKKPQTLRELKLAFKIDKYDKCYKLDVSAWHSALLERRMLLGALSAVRKQPTLLWGEKDIILSFLEDPFVELLPDRKSVARSKHSEAFVKEQSCLDLVARYQMLEKKRPSTLSKCKKVVKQLSEEWPFFSSAPPTVLAPIPPDVPAILPYGSVGDTAVVVNLSAPDHVLFSHFKTWLTNARQSRFPLQRRANRVTKRQLKKWADNKVLGYLDLQMFSLHLGIKITQAEMGYMLFPDVKNSCTTDKVRLTVKPLAEEISSHSFLMALRALALDRKKK